MLCLNCPHDPCRGPPILWIYESTPSFYPILFPDVVECSACARLGVHGEFHPCQPCHISLEFMIHTRLSQATHLDPLLWKAQIPLRQSTCSFSISPHLSVLGDPTGFSGFRVTTSREASIWGAVCHPIVNLMLIWLQLVQKRLCQPGSEPVA